MGDMKVSIGNKLKPPIAKKRGGGRAKSISHAELAKYFHLPIDAAAKELKICVTVLKKQCRTHGIKRWPHRKLRALDKLAQKLRSEDSLNTDKELCNIELQSVHQKKNEVINPANDHHISHKTRTPSTSGAEGQELKQRPSAAVGHIFQNESNAPVAVNVIQRQGGGPGGYHCGNHEFSAGGVPNGAVSYYMESGYVTPTSFDYGAHYSQSCGTCAYPNATHPQRQDYLRAPYGRNSGAAAEIGYRVDPYGTWQYYPQPSYSTRHQEGSGFTGQRGAFCPSYGEDCYAEDTGKTEHAKAAIIPGSQMRGEPLLGPLPTSQITNEVGSNEDNRSSELRKQKGSPRDRNVGLDQADKEAGNDMKKTMNGGYKSPSKRLKGGNNHGMSSLHSLVLASTSLKHMEEKASLGIKEELKQADGERPTKPGQRTASDATVPKYPNSSTDDRLLDNREDLQAIERITSKANILQSLRMVVWTANADLVVKEVSGPELHGVHGNVLRAGLKIKSNMESPQGANDDLQVYLSALAGKMSQNIFTRDGKSFLQVTGPMREKSGTHIVGVCGAIVETQS
mmetsp:Transcript_16683/g.68334  ORF Transcript_16683/g.68334 Transcript_16683/m.68334 type:complete len:567 (+) Transcript_16683:475-2175(+)|eukprot:CAMPEP_0113954300 /NCGR_PEP_ID=MMETSP0011_2-20120614/437_1 /TAXON_ID=101924 /ORGANISM="Rhodosorus marinus" /LENGTH=566 /DNA_ID=CAMNT_0000963335 /DNA_START=223 /DNA_END=1923 /DNA_ORIENTATION=+ /assembly_acc=CAM_ASM_000156